MAQTALCPPPQPWGVSPSCNVILFDVTVSGNVTTMLGKDFLYIVICHKLDQSEFIDQYELLWVTLTSFHYHFPSGRWALKKLS